MMAIDTQMAEAVSSESWLPPAMASPPKSLMVMASIAMSTINGKVETAIEGCRVVLLFIHFACYVVAKIGKT